MIENDRQLRCWLAILYPQKEDRHDDFIKEIQFKEFDYFFINHIAKFDEDGKQLNEPHTHIWIKFTLTIRFFKFI